MKKVLKWVVKSGKFSEEYKTREKARSVKRFLKGCDRKVSIERQEFTHTNSKTIR